MKSKAKSKKPVVEEKPKRFHSENKYWNIARKIENSRPNAEILYNTLVDVYGDGYERGFETNNADRRKFKESAEKRRKASWDSAITAIEDQIHNKPVKQV